MASGSNDQWFQWQMSSMISESPVKARYKVMCSKRCPDAHLDDTKTRFSQVTDKEIDGPVRKIAELSGVDWWTDKM